jgi:hypothetical protein
LHGELREARDMIDKLIDGQATMSAQYRNFSGLTGFRPIRR